MLGAFWGKPFCRETVGPGTRRRGQQGARWHRCRSWVQRGSHSPASPPQPQPLSTPAGGFQLLEQLLLCRAKPAGCALPHKILGTGDVPAEMMYSYTGMVQSCCPWQQPRFIGAGEGFGSWERGFHSRCPQAARRNSGASFPESIPLVLAKGLCDHIDGQCCAGWVFRCRAPKPHS